MKKICNILFVAVFSFVNAFSFIGCREIEAEAKEVRACWVSSVGNLDFPSKMGLTEASLKAEIDSIVDHCKKNGLNTIFFQVRPMGDALYRSEIFPWSVYLSGTQGIAPEHEFDPLEYFINRSHTSGIELHGWINPYRIGTGQNVWEKLSADNPARIHREYTVTCNAGLYYNPGHPEARQLILNGVSELVRNYEIDGIHFDDYFYPYNLEGFDDSAVYAQYGNGLSLEDFRRDSVNQLVKSVHTLIKTLNNEVQFGISPFGIWANKSIDPTGSDTSGMSSYASIFSDSKKWVEEGWLDYVCPQIYWSFENKAAPYDVLVDWWDQLCTKNNTKLYIGIALYKVGTDEDGWEEGSIMERQLQYAAAKKSYAGHCFFRYGLMIENPKGALDSIRRYYGEETAAVTEKLAEQQISAEYVELKATTELKITSPGNGAVFTEKGVSVSGVTKAGETVTVNGIQALVSSNGFFSAYVPLDMGINTLTVRAGNAQKRITVTRKNSAQSLKALDLTSAYPQGEVIRNSGDVITFEIDGSAGAAVTLSNGIISIPLLPVSQKENHYIGKWTVPAFPAGDKLALNDFYFEVSGNGAVIKEPANLSLYLYNGGYCEQRVLQADANIFDESKGGSLMDHDPLCQGAYVKVVGVEGTRALLDNGFWIEAELLGDEAATGTIAGYDYDVVTVSSKKYFGYSSFCDGKSLEISLSAGGNLKFDVDFDQADLQLKLAQTVQRSTLTLSYRSGRQIAGYEIFPQKNKITVYMRYHTDELSGKTIVLDAGHGGEDPGALGPGGISYPSESALNLLLTSALKDELEKKGVYVLLTRTADDTVSLAQRVEKSTEIAPDLFISLHHNAADQTADFNAVSGGLTLYSSPISEILAQCLANNLWDGISGEGKVPFRRQSLYVCRQTRYPSVLVEAGYLCNPLEYEMLCQEDIARKIAENIVKGLENYFVTVCS